MTPEGLKRESLGQQELALKTELATQAPFRRSLLEEREIIANVLAETRGRMSGPSGAATRLGVPPSTIESMIRSMNINKYRFKSC
jgi:hypothetical protein